MEIDRSNYEIWFIDWLDGKLNDLQVERLKLFLDENPELKEEFNELALISLKPIGKSFPHKDHLKKSIADISWSQFEYLCISHLENDLSLGQQTELFEAIEMDPEKKSSFELIQKLKLAPANISYKYKSKLKKRTVFQNVIRLSVIGLSAAATIALLITAYLLIPRNQIGKSKDGMLSVSSKNITADSNLVLPVVKKLTDNKITDNKFDIPGKTSQNITPKVYRKISDINKSESKPIPQSDSLNINTGKSVIKVDKISVVATIGLENGIKNNTLAASKVTLPVPVEDDERGSINKFISKTFREKILKEKTSKNSPLKGYEIAEAGVASLNKLFGWEMALNEKNDENGKLKSVYFSSRLLKFNAPVKKSDLVP